MAWGISESFRVVDVVNPIDTRKPGMTDIEDLRLAVAMTRFDLYTADECFLTGSGAEIIPVIKIDGREIGSGKPGNMGKRVTEVFRKLVEQPS